jgi:threonylcarbamoyladenosine tRNA methylthiotransferase MtaB
MPRIKFYTLGCKVNQYDTQSIRERFLARGFKEAAGGDKADLYLINTCTVTAVADTKSRAIIQRCVNQNPKARVIVTGCMVKNDFRQLAKIKGVTFIVSKSFFSEGISDFSLHTRAFVKIQDGCDNSCAYCKVPLARGRSRSRPIKEIVQEAQNLSKKGFKEIVLTGICLGAYGKDLGKDIGLVTVIEKLEKIKGLLRLRLSSIEAGDVTDELIKKIAKSKKICRHLHIPIQSGDDEILRKMRRRYSRDYYIGLVNKLKENIPGLALTTDCLVGFPGESEKHFRNTLDLVKRISPLKMHIFPYSRREGTYAANDPSGEVSPLLIRERIGILKKAAEYCAKACKKSFLKQRLPVLFEGESNDLKGYWEGYTDNYIKVLFKSQRILRNKLMYVKLKEVSGEAVIVS